MVLGNEVSPIEVLMESALKENQISFDKQVSCYGEYTYKNHYGYYRKKSDVPKYISDFVVCGEKSKIVVECDGFRYHSSNTCKARDAVRDLWMITHGYDDVLRFTSHDIFNHLQSCIRKIKNSLFKMDRIYHLQDEKIYFQPAKIPDSPTKAFVMKTMSEFLTIFAHSGEHRSKKKQNINNQVIIQSIQQRLRAQHFNLSYDLMHFQYPDLVRQLNKGEIDIFFSGFNIPYLIYIDKSLVSSPLHVLEGTQFIKVIISKFKPPIVSIKNWIWIHSTKKKIMASDVLDIDYNDILLEDFSEKARSLEKEYVQLCKKQSNRGSY